MKMSVISVDDGSAYLCGLIEHTHTDGQVLYRSRLILFHSEIKNCLFVNLFGRCESSANDSICARFTRYDRVLDTDRGIVVVRIEYFLIF